VVTSSGRESVNSTRGNDYYVSPERVKAIKDAGKWDNIKERRKMIEKYVEYDRNNRS
jgi:hypothetical protein